MTRLRLQAWAAILALLASISHTARSVRVSSVSSAGRRSVSAASG